MPKLAMNICLTASLLVFFSCKGPDEDKADVKTLDNFSNGSALRDNECSGDPNLWKDMDEKEKLSKFHPMSVLIKPDSTVSTAKADEAIDSLITSMTAVPSHIQKQFMAFVDKITLTEDLTRCYRIFGKPGDPEYVKFETDKIKGCYYYTAGTTSSSSVELLVRPEPEAIKHNFVLLLGYVYAQVYPRVRPAAAPVNFKMYKIESESFKTFKAELAERYLRDYYDRRSLFTLSSLDRYIGIDAADTLSGSQADGILDRLSYQFPGEKNSPQEAGKNLRKQWFADHVFAQSFDSYYCKSFTSHSEDKVDRLLKDRLDEDEKAEIFEKLTNTKYLMRDLFSNTFGKFQTLNEFVLSQAENRLPESDSSTSEGFTYFKPQKMRLLASQEFLQMFLQILSGVMAGGGGGMPIPSSPPPQFSNPSPQIATPTPITPSFPPSNSGGGGAIMGGGGGFGGGACNPGSV